MIVYEEIEVEIVPLILAQTFAIFQVQVKPVIIVEEIEIEHISL